MPYPVIEEIQVDQNGNPISASNPTPVNLAVALDYYEVPLNHNYFRLIITAYTSGTVGGQGQFSTLPSTLFQIDSVSPIGQLTPANAFYVGGVDGTSKLRGLGVADRDAIGGANILGVTPLLYNGSSADRQRTPTTFKTFSGLAIASETTVWTPTSGKEFRLMGWVITQNTAAGDITVRDNTGATAVVVIPANTIGVAQVSPSLGNGKLAAATNDVLTFQGVASQAVSGFVFGTEE